MGKHRKTRQEKMIADSRHVLYHLDTNPVTKSDNKVKSSSPKIEIPTYKAPAVSYSYVTVDLQRTAIVTAAIIIAQILLFIVLNRI